MLYNIDKFFTRILPAILTLVFGGIAFASNPPTAPTSISVSTDSNGTTVIQWGLSYDSDGWIANYELQKDNTVIYIGNTTSYTDTNIVPGETYHYTVVAIDNQGDRSPISGFASATIASSNAQTGAIGSYSCVDSDGDGWGWDGYRSCSLATLSTSQINVESPTGLPFHDCVDDDGDGWGWDGRKSCNMDVLITTTDATGCFTANAKKPGWTGIEFCFVEMSNGNVSISASEDICVDLDGDGFGWNGFATCDPRPLFSAE